MKFSTPSNKFECDFRLTSFTAAVVHNFSSISITVIKSLLEPYLTDSSSLKFIKMEISNKQTLEKIFGIFTTEKGQFNVAKFFKTLNDFGILNDDPRVSPFLKRVKEFQEKHPAQLNLDAFLTLLDSAIEPLIVKAFSGKLIVPSFSEYG